MNKDKPNIPQAVQTNCWDCTVKDCDLPNSKIIPGRKLSEYAYKRHPECRFSKHPKLDDK